MINITNSLQDEFIAGAKRLGEALIEIANRYDAQAKFKYELTKPGVSEFSLNECRVAAAPEKFLELERKFKLCNMSAESADEFAEKIIDGINGIFNYCYKPALTEEERRSVREVIRKYFRSQKNTPL